MSTEQMGTYEKIYFALWELGQRYGNFVQFRVIGRSHDDRMIPMLEIGKGDTCIICLSGVESGDRNVPAIVWKKESQVVRESKKPEQNLRWDLRNNFMRK